MTSEIIAGAPHRVRLSLRARTCRIHVGPDGVVLVVPRGFPLRSAEKFLREKEMWVRAKLEQARRPASEHKPNQIMLRGKLTRVSVEDIPAGKAAVMESEDSLRVLCPVGGDSDPGWTLCRWLRDVALRELDVEVRRQSEAMRLIPRRVTLRDPRTRWGSCSSKGAISLSWRLIMAPPEVQRYVIVHELVHLREMNHGSNFWRLVEQYAPGRPAHQAWLRAHASLLHAPMKIVRVAPP